MTISLLECLRALEHDFRGLHDETDRLADHFRSSSGVGWHFGEERRIQAERNTEGECGAKRHNETSQQDGTGNVEM